MSEIIKKIGFILSKKEKNSIAGMVVMMVIGGFLELLGVAGIFPLITAITEGTVNDSKRIIWMCLILIGIYVVKNLFLMLMYKCIYGFVYKGKSRLATRMFEVYMKEPYEFHLNRNFSVIQRAVRSDVDGFYALLKALLQLMSEVIICVVLCVLLFITNFWMALILALLLGTCVGLVLFLSKRRIKRLGQEDMEYAAGMNKWLMQGISGIKAVKLLGRENFFTDSFQDNSSKSSKNQEKQQLLIQCPRLITETICVGAVLVWVIIASLNNVNVTEALPTLAVFAVAAFRLLPSVGKINGYLAEYGFFKPRVDFIYEDLIDIEKARDISADKETGSENDYKKLELKDRIELKDITFAYSGADNPVLNQINMTIKAGQSIGVVGPSGAGKTTLVDVLMGLLLPKNGDITVDGVSVYNNLPGWYSCIGYVPQDIYLSDDSIENNVAFGVPVDAIDHQKVDEALKKANIYDFVMEMSDKKDTVIGDRGVRLSGGQRQRIGIARALYTNPDILILDEATSALDNDTEAAVMDAIESLHGQITMVIIAHRLTTIENCDEIYKVEDGRISLNG